MLDLVVRVYYFVGEFVQKSMLASATHNFQYNKYELVNNFLLERNVIDIESYLNRIQEMFTFSNHFFATTRDIYRGDIVVVESQGVFVYEGREPTDGNWTSILDCDIPEDIKRSEMIIYTATLSRKILECELERMNNPSYFIKDNDFIISKVKEFGRFKAAKYVHDLTKCRLPQCLQFVDACIGKHLLNTIKDINKEYVYEELSLWSNELI